MDSVFLLAQRSNEINQWLDKNPLVLGALFFGIGALVGGWGLYELSTGVAHSKFGRRLEGSQATLYSGIRIFAGAVCMAFALYKMLIG